MIDERRELDDRDRELLRKWGFRTTDPARDRRLVLVGRLQRALGVTDDGRYGPNTHENQREKRLPLGPELSGIVDQWRPA
jgi:hypothetical protein